MKTEFNVKGFSEVSEKEMMVVNGGGWLRGLLASIGCAAAVIATVATGGTAAIVISAAAAGAAAGSTIGGAFEA